jgi:hypothetical protein
LLLLNLNSLLYHVPINSDSALPPEQSWAGDRIICLGDYHKDLPDGMPSISEQEELDRADEGEEMTLYAFADERYQSVDGISAFNRPQLSSGHWILRNLSKYEYVREEAVKVASVEGMGDNHSSKKIGLGQVVLSRICWSTDDSCAMSYYDKDIHRGMWAGDRFDITTINQVVVKDRLQRKAVDRCQRQGGKGNDGDMGWRIWKRVARAQG